jgi:hypothetical protein
MFTWTGYEVNLLELLNVLCSVEHENWPSCRCVIRAYFIGTNFGVGPTEYSRQITFLSYHQLDFVIIHRNLPITERPRTKSFSCGGRFCLRWVLEVWILGSRSFPLKTGFLYARLPFRTSFTLLMKWNIMTEIKT